MSTQRQPGARPGIVTRLGRVGMIGLLAASAAVAGAGPAAAADQAQLKDVSIGSGPMPIESFHITYFSLAPLPATIIDVDVAVSAEWNATVKTAVGWDSDEVRQGADLDVGRSAPLTTGTLTATWTVTGNVGLFGGNADIDIGVHTIEKTVGCNPKVSGASFDCFVGSDVFTIQPGTGPGTPYIKLGINSAFDVTPEGIAVSRSLTVGNQTVAGPDSLGLGTSTESETIPMPCTAQVGAPVEYDLASYSWTPSVAASHYVIGYIGVMDPSGLVELPAVGTLLKQVDANYEFALNGAGTSFDFGSLQANDVVPTIDPMGPFSGTEGSPISFSATTNSNCSIASRVWQFSDGTTSYGPAPKRSFGDDGAYDGQLTVTDVTGLSATQSFVVSVDNVAPAANAGPDTTSDWGRPVQFNGQATDPGWADQSTLQYAWDFGDGSPSASGGASVVHMYAMPGSYGAGFTACDNDGACGGDSRQVVVTKRDTTLGYTGALKGGASKNTTLTAVLVDEYGQPVVGKKVTFTLGSQSAIGTTDASGLATVTFKLTQKPGSYSLGVAFPAGDAKYNGSADLGRTFVIGK